MTPAWWPKRIWPGDEPVAPPHPAPEVLCRPAAEDEIPRGARPVRTQAQANGWTVVATYARGTRPGRVLVVVDSLVLRMRRGGELAAAMWLDGKFECAVRGPAARSMNLRDLRAELAVEPGGAVSAA